MNNQFSPDNMTDEDALKHISSLMSRKASPPPEKSGLLRQTLGDTAVALTQGGGNVIKSTGEAIDFAGDKLGVPMLRDVGGSIRNYGAKSQELSADMYSPEAKASMAIPTYDETTGKITISPRKLVLSAVQSVPDLGVAVIPGGAMVKAGEALGVARGTAAALKAVGSGSNRAKAVGQFVERGLAAGAVEGVQAGLANAADTRKEIADTPDDKLFAIPGNAEILSQAGGDAIKARQIISDRAGGEVLGKTLLTTGGISAALGGGVTGMLSEKAAAKSMALSTAEKRIPGQIIEGIASEAAQEGPQSYTEQVWQNLATQKYTDPTKSATDGALNAGIEGALSGGLLGALGGEAHTNHISALASKETPPEVRAQILLDTAKSIDDPAERQKYIDYVSGKILAGQDVDTKQNFWKRWIEPQAVSVAPAISETPAAIGTPTAPLQLGYNPVIEAGWDQGNRQIFGEEGRQDGSRPGSSRVIDAEYETIGDQLGTINGPLSAALSTVAHQPAPVQSNPYAQFAALPFSGAPVQSGPNVMALLDNIQSQGGDVSGRRVLNDQTTVPEGPEGNKVESKVSESDLSSTSDNKTVPDYQSVAKGLKDGSINFSDIKREKDGKFTTWSLDGVVYAYTEGRIDKNTLIKTIESNVRENIANDLPEVRKETGKPKNLPQLRRKDVTRSRNLLEDIKRSGGINLPSIVNALDINEVRGPKGKGNRYLKVTKANGVGMDQMAQQMLDNGWAVPTDTNGNADVNAFAQMLKDAVNGVLPIHPDDEIGAVERAAAEYEAEKAPEITDEHLDQMNQDDTLVEHSGLNLDDLLEEIGADDFKAVYQSLVDVDKIAAQVIEEILNGKQDSQQVVGGSQETPEKGSSQEVAGAEVGNQNEDGKPPLSEVVSKSGEQQSKLFATPPAFGKKSHTGGQAVSTGTLLDNFTPDPQQDLFSQAKPEVTSSKDTLIPVDNLPDDILVEINALDESGNKYKIQMAAKEALNEQDRAIKEAESLLECVRG